MLQQTVGSCTFICSRGAFVAVSLETRRDEYKLQPIPLCFCKKVRTIQRKKHPHRNGHGSTKDDYS